MFSRLKLLPLSLAAPLLFFALTAIHAQEAVEGERPRGSIPEVLLRPQKGEAPRYPVDTVIGPLGQGGASREAYVFARQTAAALVAGNMNAASLFGVNRPLLESYLAKLREISPRGYRLGSGREEADGAVSFLVRFMGREQGIAGELYIRLVEQPVAQTARAAEDGPVPESGEETPARPAVEQTLRRVWVFEELILDEPRSREEAGEDKRRFNFPPYERFF
jgi:hypothetical protein